MQPRNHEDTKKKGISWSGQPPSLRRSGGQEAGHHVRQGRGPANGGHDERPGGPAKAGHDVRQGGNPSRVRLRGRRPSSDPGGPKTADLGARDRYARSPRSCRRAPDHHVSFLAELILLDDLTGRPLHETVLLHETAPESVGNSGDYWLPTSLTLVK